MLLLFVLTCTEQRHTSIGDAVKREIGQGLVERHGVDKGIAVAATCAFYKDDDIQPLCVNLGRFKRLKKIDLVSRGM